MSVEMDDALTPETGGHTADQSPAVSTGGWLFAAMSASFLIAVILASVFIPTVDSTSRLENLPPAVAEGIKIYNGEGCAECHSRMVRQNESGCGSPATWVTLSEIMVDTGSSRIGPDLQNLASGIDSETLMAILANPSAFQPGTVMPSYSRLSDMEKIALAEYLLYPISTDTTFDRLRTVNSIEEQVPDRVIKELSRNFDPETGMFISPVMTTPEFIVTGSGIYNSRCASCHALPDAELVSPKIQDASDIYLYWRIMDGTAGSEMPSWRGTISSDGIWRVIAYIRSLSEVEALDWEVSIDPEEPLWFDLSVSEEEMQWLFPSWEDGPDEIDTTDNLPADNRDSADTASGEEGASTGASDNSAGATESEADPDAGEETP